MIQRMIIRLLDAYQVRKYFSVLLMLFYRCAFVLKNREEAGIFATELRVKLHLIFVVGMSKIRKSLSFQQAISSALSKNKDFPPFIVEGVVFHYCRHHAEVDLRQEIKALTHDDKCLTQYSMMHVGMGMYLAFDAVSQFKQAICDDKRREIVKSFYEACLHRSLKNFAGCAIEAMGLVFVIGGVKPENCQNWLQNTLALSDEKLNIESTIAWVCHGIGRGLYFLPKNFLPSYACRFMHKSLALLQKKIFMLSGCLPDTLKVLAIENCIAGFFWAVTATSLTQKDILLYYLKNLLHSFPSLSQHQQAIQSGIAKNLLMLYITKPLKTRVSKHMIELSFVEANFTCGEDQAIWDEYVCHPYRQYQETQALDFRDLKIDQVFKC